VQKLWRVNPALVKPCSSIATNPINNFYFIMFVAEHM
jgi:hypothetical protein